MGKQRLPLTVNLPSIYPQIYRMRTIAEIGTECGKTKQAAMSWRSKAESKYGVLPFTQRGKAKVYASSEIEKILEFAPQNKPEIVQAEIVDSAPTGMMQLLREPTLQGSQIGALAISPAVDSSLAMARQTLESKSDLTQAVTNLVQGLGCLDEVADQLGGAVTQRFGNRLRSTVAAGIDAEARSVLSQLGLQTNNK